MAQAISQLIESGLTSALFIEATDHGTPTESPQFKASAAFAPMSKETLWAGLVWTPAVAPKIWQQLLTLSYVDLTPPETMTVVTSDRNTVRTAFAVDSNEYLILARIGPADDPRGLLALVSSKSIVAELQSILMLLTSSVPRDKYIKTAA